MQAACQQQQVDLPSSRQTGTISSYPHSQQQQQPFRLLQAASSGPQRVEQQMPWHSQPGEVDAVAAVRKVVRKGACEQVSYDVGSTKQLAGQISLCPCSPLLLLQRNSLIVDDPARILLSLLAAAVASEKQFDY